MDSSERLSHPEVSALTGHLAGLSAAGLPLASGLRALGDEVHSPRLRLRLASVSTALDAGDSLEAALGAKHGGLPPHVRGLVAAGVRTGKLGEVLGRFSGFATTGDDLRRELVLRLVYPILCLLLGTAVLLFACIVLGRAGIHDLYRDFGVQVPLLTLWFLSVSTLINDTWPMLLGVFLAVVAGWFVLGLFLNRATYRELMGHVPLLGPVWRYCSLAEFCHLLALLLESELPLPEAVTLAGEGVGDAGVESSCRAMRRDVEEGIGLAEASTRRRLLPPGLARLLAWAEGHRGLPEALHMMGEMFEARARAQANFAGTVCSVLVVVLVLSGIALGIGAVLIPLVSLISKLSG